MDIREHNRDAWNHQTECGNPWTIPAGDDEILAARSGRCRIYLSPNKPVPENWLGALHGRDVLCLASGGGQQGPNLAAAGARVTVFDNSPGQLARDREVARRHALDLRTVEGDMRDLSVFPSESFDLIVHPVSNLFVPEVRPVWREAWRVLRTGGRLLAGFNNPIRHMFDIEAYEDGMLVPRHALPTSDVEILGEKGVQLRRERGIPLEFGHTLQDQIGGQLDAGFVITGFYEDRDRPEENDPLSKLMDTYIATRAEKHRP